jgi:hypothetical protein
MGFRVHSVADASFVSEVMDRKHPQVKSKQAANSAKITYFIERETGEKRISNLNKFAAAVYLQPLLLWSVR